MAFIHVVGLGPGDISGLPLGTFDLLQSGLPVFLRTRIHPAVDDLEARGMSFESFDDFYEQGETFEEVYLNMATRLVECAKEQGDIVYAVPGHPLIAEQSVQNLYSFQNEDVQVVIGPGQSFLDAICTVLKIDPIEGLLLLDGTVLKHQQLQTGVHTLIAQVFNQTIATEVKLTLMNLYPDEFEVTVIRAAGVKALERVEKVAIYELDRLPWIDHLTTLYIPPTEETSVVERDPWYVAGLVEKLRAPDGCPWDRKQTHQSLRRYVIEEAYEVAEAIDDDDMFALADELGDLYLQVLLHAQIGNEYGEFSLRDVYAALASKILRRHPHVFGDVKVSTVEAAEASWNAAKERELEGIEDQPLLSQVKRGLPPLQRAFEVQKRAASVQFDWDNLQDVLEKVKEEMTELETEVKAGQNQRATDELGDLWFASINLARWLDIDVEAALLQAIKKFEQRFSYVEEYVRSSGKTWNEFTAEELNSYWNEAKIKQNHKN